MRFNSDQLFNCLLVFGLLRGFVVVVVVGCFDTLSEHVIQEQLCDLLQFKIIT